MLSLLVLLLSSLVFVGCRLAGSCCKTGNAGLFVVELFCCRRRRCCCCCWSLVLLVLLLLLLVLLVLLLSLLSLLCCIC